jgi:UDP-N-acetylmuramoyl-tripeptide--D-alanyl-D-alanine ligase
MKQAPFGTRAGSPRLTTAFILETLRENEVRHTGPESLEFTSVTTDSRKVPAGSLFVAIRGENFDGHGFVETALKAGARSALVQKGRVDLSRFPQSAFFEVDDSLEGYRALAQGWRGAFEIPVIAVAGSNGKTTSKEFLAAMLAGKYRKVLKTQGSQNGFVGIPLTLLELRPGDEAAVIEIGIDEIGAMEKHIARVRPTAAIVTSIGPEHLEKLRDLETIAREELLALDRVARQGGVTAVHLDDPAIRPLWKSLSGGKKIGYTLGAPPAGHVYQGVVSGDRLTISGADLQKPFEVALPLLGRHNAMNLLGAAALALGIGLTPDEIARGLQSFQGAPGRSQVRELPSGVVVLCDYYNASPPSVTAGLALLAELGRTQRRFACLADMKELGPGEENFHRELAAPILKHGIQNVLLFGDRMKFLADELKRRGFKGERLEHFASRPDLARALSGAVRAGDAVLIKGSHSMKMEEVFDGLRAALQSGAQ